MAAGAPFVGLRERRFRFDIGFDDNNHGTWAQPTTPEHNI